MKRATVKLGDFLTLKRGYDLPEHARVPGAVPVVSSSGITGMHKEAKVEGPGVVTGRYGTLGEVYYLENAFWPLNTALYVQDFKGNNRRFAAYFLKWVLQGTEGSKAAVPGVNRNDLHARSVLVPETMQEQEAIAATLATYDDLIETNRRRIQLLERAARLLYKEWFVHLRFPGHETTPITDGVPQGWERKKIADVCETIGGGTPSTKISNYWDGNIPWVVPTDITNNNSLVLLETARKITETGLRKSAAKMLPAGAILMTSRASVGFFAVMDYEVCTNQGFINIVPFDSHSRMYMLFNLINRADEIRSNAKGTTYPEISKGRFREMEIIMPNVELMRQFAAFADDALRQVRHLMQANKNLARARDLLLPKLMSGEVAV